MDGKPFWWVGPDGKSKVLFLQPGGYANSGSMGKKGLEGPDVRGLDNVTQQKMP